MISRHLIPALFRFATAWVVCLSMVLLSGHAGAAKSRAKKPITKPKFDPDAEQVELFAGIQKGRLDVTVLPKNSKQGNILIENKTKKPLTVKLPEAVVGVHVLKQFAGAQPGGLGGGLGGGGNQNNSNNNNQGQPFGGGMGMMGGMGMGGMGMGGMGMGGLGGGGGFFSIPPEKVVRLPYHSVCLAHGKREPRPRMRYRLVRVEQFTKDPVLQQLIRLVAMNRIDPQVAQAAAWHLTDKMSWRELAMKKRRHLGGVAPEPYFSPAQLYRAQSLIGLAIEKLREKGKQAPAQPQPVRRRGRVR